MSAKLPQWELKRFDSQSQYLTGAMGVYIRTWNPSGSPRNLFEKYMAYPGFVGYVAVANDVVLGMGFGTSAVDGNWWFESVKEQIGEHPALKDAWVFGEIAVLEEFRESGIGSALHNALLRDQPHKYAILSTGSRNNVARRFYENRGWKYLSKAVVLILPGSDKDPSQAPADSVVMWTTVGDDDPTEAMGH